MWYCGGYCVIKKSAPLTTCFTARREQRARACLGAAITTTCTTPLQGQGLGPACTLQVELGSYNSYSSRIIKPYSRFALAWPGVFAFFEDERCRPPLVLIGWHTCYDYVRTCDDLTAVGPPYWACLTAWNQSSL